ncbi:MAG: PAS domain S-box protein [Desulfuromonadaceae bacterium]|nr:PAS domain S-box protein [Desulfuromonadaceae bacterium]
MKDSGPRHPQALNVFENIHAAIIVIGMDDRIVDLNPAAESLTGFSRRQALDQAFSSRFRSQTALVYLVSTARTSGRSVSDHDTILLERPQQSAIPISASAAPLYNDSGDQEGVILTLHNASHLRQLEQEIQRSDRLAMLGTLAAGLAHEIKNPLGGIKGAAQLLAMELTERPDLLEYTEVMIRESNRVNEIIEELMNLTRPRSAKFRDVNLSKVLGEIVLLQQQSPQAASTRIVLQLDPSIPPIAGDPALLTRLFLNLIKNALEATHDREGGQVRISSRIDTEHHLNRPGQGQIAFVVIRIQDNGCGIDDDQMGEIFTPFYTTKNQGTGLGLALCQKIVHDHDGLLHCESQAGVGTRCSVYLPLPPNNPCM